MNTDFGETFPDGSRVGADRESAAQRPREPTASSGFGSPGSDFTIKRIDLNDALVRHPQATFVMRAAGDAMRDAGIWDDDVLVVDRAISAAHGHLVVARLDDELVCRRLVMAGGVVALESAEQSPVRVLCNDERPLEVWGVVTYVIKPMRV
jgi:DNA polymerase V